MAQVDNSLTKTAEAALVVAIAKIKDALAAGAANADVVASLNEQITAKDQALADKDAQIKQLTDELAASQAESTDLGNKLTADAASLAALVPPAA